MRVPIAELADAATIEQSFRVGDKQLRVNRDGGKYILLKLADRTGTITAMMWNATETIYDSFDRGDYVHVKGRSQIHKGNLQLIATRVERMDVSEIDESQFDRFDAAASESAMERLVELLGDLQSDPLRSLGETFLADQDFVDALKTAAAAVSNHHAYPGGLLRHTVDLMEISIFIGDRYEHLDRELLMFGAFLHDLGKIGELAGDGEIAYTDRGQLVGHIVIGLQMLDEKIEECHATIPGDLRLQLEHLIVAHHGLLEYGSPRIPQTLEAVALHHIDNLDAKLTSYTAIIETDVSADQHWTNYNPSIGRKLWKK